MSFRPHWPGAYGEKRDLGAEGMSKIAKKTGLGRESLYKALSPDGNPALSTILKVLKAFDINLRAACL